MSLLVMGSVNRDITAQLPEFPQPGETLLATGSETATGGKSANQAVAAALVGAQSHLIARCGSDAAGAEAVRSLREAGVHVDAVTPGRAAQGMAFITVRSDGENTIVVVPGANAELRAQDCPQELLAGAGWILLSLEVPLDTVLETAAKARAARVKVALNASPLPERTLDLRDVDLVIVNEGEAAALLERAGAAEPGSQPEDLAAALGIETLIVTRGAAGASIHASGHATVYVPSVEVQAVDTSGAGDAFAGALLGRITCGDNLETAAAIAARFAASATTRVGAQASYPRDFQVEEPPVFSVARDS
ncbi:ribokinase [Nesterenkonia sp. E16_7]|uniref:ribokinase n=1 Tax=unclassified Nesterenkonia TaxID=2629769 RepID=UPI001A9262BE|nr:MULTISPECIES: ribokinase [unclassified Nesterenkonia]MBO0594935.1 ribokinase [Nesterenkonia sp. E16_10]MBO0599683.1 ribokinase [Nesterenkonia sp. E16_7]